LVELLVENTERQGHRVLPRELSHDIDHVVSGPVVSSLARLPVPIHVQWKRSCAGGDCGATHRKRIGEGFTSGMSDGGASEVDPLVLSRYTRITRAILPRAIETRALVTPVAGGSAGLRGERALAARHSRRFGSGVGEVTLDGVVLSAARSLDLARSPATLISGTALACCLPH
jgi:hypothetical protein